MARRFDHDSDPVVQMIADRDPDTYDAAWQQWMEHLETEAPATPAVPAAVELAQACELWEG